ncbi:Y+L amino acid transporter 2 [Halotydeus destructor]|nr:Y+L amino acid transporter 2 [Halotydeus destructor]
MKEGQEMTVSPEVDNKVKLKREITLLNGITLIVGSIIGAGIFVSPKGVFENSGQSIVVSLVIWTLCGLFSMLGSICFAELGTTITRSGGDYAYIMEAFGPLPAFLNLWITLAMVRPAMMAISALTFSVYILAPLYPDCPPPVSLLRLTSATCLCFLAYINCRSVRWAMNLQGAFTLAKCLALFVIIVSGLYHLFSGKADLSGGKGDTVQVNKTDIEAGKIVLAFYSGLFAYGGWNYVNFVTEELKNPYKNLPRAAIVGILTVTVFYVLANISYFSLLTSEEIMTSPAIATVFAQKAINQAAVWFMPLAVAVSTFGGLNGTLFTTARLFYVGSQEKQVPVLLGMISLRRSTPVPSLIVSCTLSLLMLVTVDVYTLINYFSVTLWLWTGVVTAALIQLRIKKPQLYRPIKFSLALPATFTVGCVLLTMVAIYSDPWGALGGMVFLFSGVPVYYLLKALLDANLGQPVTHLLQKVLQVTSPETDSPTQM